MCCEHISPTNSGSKKISPKTSNPQVVKLIRNSLQNQAQSRGKKRKVGNPGHSLDNSDQGQSSTSCNAFGRRQRVE